MTICPTDAELARHAVESLELEIATRVDDHLRNCAACRQGLKQKRLDAALFKDVKKVLKQTRIHVDVENSIVHESNLSEADFSDAMALRGYKILHEIKGGGQGIVYKAIQLATNRHVAVKQLILRGHSVAEQLQRFERETEVVAGLSHANIVTVFDSGTVDQCPFYVMEFVNGTSLDKFPLNQISATGTKRSNNRNSIRTTMSLFRKICSAVSYAHQLGIIHRDLKPDNILIDDNGDPQVLDFGLAKLADQQNPVDLTQTGQFMGTLAYASPEQLRFNSSLVDTRSDVYSMGVILYEMLTGQLPYLLDVGLTQSIKNIVESDPISPRELCDDLDHDIETIVLKALSKDPARRYQSVAQLDLDIELYLDNRPIDAKRDSTFYVLRKSLQRNKPLVFAVLTISFVTIGALIVSLIFWNQTVNQRDLALAAKANESIAKEEAEFQSYVANIVAAKASATAFDVGESKRRLENAPAAYRNWERGYWLSRSDVSVRTFRHHKLYINDFALFPDGETIVSLGGDKKLRRWSLVDPNDFVELSFPHQGRRCIVNHEGSRIVCLFDQTIQLMDANTLKVLQTRRIQHLVLDIAFVRGSSKIAICQKNQQTGKGEIALWDLDNDRLTILGEKFERLMGFAEHPRQKKFAIAAERLGVIDLESGRFTEILSGGPYSFVRFNQSGSLIAAAQECDVVVVETAARRETRRLSGHRLPVKHIEFGADGKTVATCSTDRTIRTWDIETTHQKSLSLGHEQEVIKIQFLDGSARLISASKDATLKLWAPSLTENPMRLEGHDNIVRAIAFSPNGKLIASASEDATVVIRNVADGTIVDVLENQSPVFSVCFSPDNLHVATASDDKLVRIWELDSRTFKSLIGHSDRVHSVDYDLDGRRLVSGSRDGTVRIWDVKNGYSIHVFDRHHDCVHNAVFDGSGKRVASRSHQHVKLWEANAGMKEVFSFAQRIGPEDFSLALHPLTRQIAAGCSIEGFGKGFINVLDPVGKSIEKTFEQHNAPITGFDFNHDGSRAVSSSFDAIKIWDVRRGKEVANLDVLNSGTYCVKFSRDGTRIAAGLSDGTLMIWNSQPAKIRDLGDNQTNDP